MRDQKGFTLLEIIIVLGMIGIMAAIAIPSVINWVPDYKLKSAARDVYSTLQRARSIAVKSNGNTAVIFDTAQNKYTVCDNWNTGTLSCDVSLRTNTLSKGISFGHGNATSAVGSVFDNEVTYVDDDIIFDSRGLGDASGYVYLDHQKNTTTYAVGSLTSGSVRILKWNGSDWE